MEIGIIEGVIALHLNIIKHILTSSKKSTIYFFMKFAQFEEWMLWYILWKFQIREQCSFFFFFFFFLNMSYATVL